MACPKGVLVGVWLGSDIVGIVNILALVWLLLRYRRRLDETSRAGTGTGTTSSSEKDVMPPDNTSGLRKASASPIVRKAPPWRFIRDDSSTDGDAGPPPS
ncbi:hypothetical protein GGS20DRAFT_584503 [Poronia punctata]|nr:hypothetical protein GGS20DRAFT_584503 [Poronia punctata]